MEQSLVRPGPSLVVVAIVLVLVAVVAAVCADLGTGAATLRAAARAAVQLIVVAAVIGTLLETAGPALAFVALMFAVAVWTSARRMAGGRPWWAAAAIGAGAVPVVVLVVAGQVVPFEGPALIAVSGIVLGGSMSASAQAGKAALEQLRARRGEVEAGLSLGLPARIAGLEVARPAAVHALIPALDQTRTVGLVTLPGAFIGVLLAGGSAAEAASAQVLVLAALLAAETIAVAVVLELAVRAGLPEVMGDAPPARSSRLR